MMKPPGSMHPPGLTSGRTYDYDAKYPQDDLGHEMGPDARFWRVYNDETDAYDSEMYQRWSDTTDVLLVFTGLFSAVVTTLLVEASGAYQDYAQINVSLISEMISIQRALANGSLLSDIPPSQLQLNSDTASTADRWINALWVVSLLLSLMAALITLLVKQWLHYYISQSSGTPRDHTLIRHFRFESLQKWRVAEIIELLPLLLHVALFLFFIGLSVFFWELDLGIAGVVVAISGITTILYIGTNLLPTFRYDCSYVTPFSQYILVMWNSHFFGRLRNNPFSFLRKWTHAPTPCYLDNILLKAEVLHHRVREARYVEEHRDFLSASAILWLHESSANPTVRKISERAPAGIPHRPVNTNGFGALRNQTLDMNRSLVRSFVDILDDVVRGRKSDEFNIEVQSTALALFHCHSPFPSSSFLDSEEIFRINLPITWTIYLSTYDFDKKQLRSMYPGQSVFEDLFASRKNPDIMATLIDLIEDKVQLPPALWNQIMDTILSKSNVLVRNSEVVLKYPHSILTKASCIFGCIDFIERLNSSMPDRETSLVSIEGMCRAYRVYALHASDLPNKTLVLLGIIENLLQYLPADYSMETAHTVLNDLLPTEIMGQALRVYRMILETSIFVTKHITEGFFEPDNIIRSFIPLMECHLQYYPYPDCFSSTRLMVWEVVSSATELLAEFLLMPLKTESVVPRNTSQVCHFMSVFCLHLKAWHSISPEYELNPKDIAACAASATFLKSYFSCRKYQLQDRQTPLEIEPRFITDLFLELVTTLTRRMSLWPGLIPHKISYSLQYLLTELMPLFPIQNIQRLPISTAPYLRIGSAVCRFSASESFSQLSVSVPEFWTIELATWMVWLVTLQKLYEARVDVAREAAKTVEAIVDACSISFPDARSILLKTIMIAVDVENCLVDKEFDDDILENLVWLRRVLGLEGSSEHQIYAYHRAVDDNVERDDENTEEIRYAKGVRYIRAPYTSIYLTEPSVFPNQTAE